MTKEELFAKLDSCIDGLLCNVNSYNNILDMSSGLSGYDSLNRCLIEMQRKDKTNIKELVSQYEVEKLGRKLKSDANVIYVVTPLKKNVYIDSETNEEANIDNLDSKEIDLGVKSGILVKKSKTTDFNLNIVYNILDTIKSENSENYVADTALIPIEIALKVLGDITKADIKKGEKTYYDPESNIIEIHKEQRGILLNSISEILYEFMENVKLSNFISSASLDVRLLLKYSVIYSIESALRNNKNITVEITDKTLRRIDTSTKLNVINISIEVGNIILESLERFGVYRSDVKSNSIEAVRKAEVLANIMQANALARIIDSSII